MLIDPYAKLVEGRRLFADTSAKFSKFLGTYDFDSSPFDWGDNYKLPNIPEVLKSIIWIFSQMKNLFGGSCPLLLKFNNTNLSLFPLPPSPFICVLMS